MERQERGSADNMRAIGKVELPRGLQPQGCRDGVLRAERMRLGSTVKARGYAVVLLEKAEATGRWASAVVEATSGHGVNDGVFYHVRWI
uniref:Uncharacterized protein n=1 Tax=Oryza glumipatula TaxID=40148 RepID=A0A0E0B3P5_9ORYZ